jgi:hypothetical protein
MVQFFLFMVKTSRFPSYLFEDIQQKNPKWSSWTCFCETVWNKNNLSKRVINRYFDALVEKDDYSRNDKKALLGQLYKLSEGIVL